MIFFSYPITCAYLFLSCSDLAPAMLISTAFCGAPVLLWVWAAVCCASSCTTSSVSSIRAITLICWLPTHTTGAITSWRAAAMLLRILPIFSIRLPATAVVASPPTLVTGKLLGFASLVGTAGKQLSYANRPSRIAASSVIAVSVTSWESVSSCGCSGFSLLRSTCGETFSAGASSAKL